MLGLITGFFVKHMIADYYLQFSWMIKDKGTYNAKGGIAHSGLHALLTFHLITFVWIWILMVNFNGRFRLCFTLSYRFC